MEWQKAYSAEVCENARFSARGNCEFLAGRIVKEAIKATSMPGRRLLKCWRNFAGRKMTCHLARCISPIIAEVME